MQGVPDNELPPVLRGSPEEESGFVVELDGVVPQMEGGEWSRVK